MTCSGGSQLPCHKGPRAALQSSSWGEGLDLCQQPLGTEASCSKPDAAQSHPGGSPAASRSSMQMTVRTSDRQLQNKGQIHPDNFKNLLPTFGNPELSLSTTNPEDVMVGDSVYICRLGYKTDLLTKRPAPAAAPRSPQSAPLAAVSCGQHRASVL